jgi:PhnB protein
MFNRNCAEALELYAKAFDAKITEVQKYGDMPPDPNFPITDSVKNLVLHSRLKIDGMEFMCSDASEGVTSSDNMYISVMTEDRRSVQKAWDELRPGAQKIYMELGPVFFALLHGSLRDKFGINWMFSVEK